MSDYKTVGKLHLLQLRCHGLTNRTSETKQEPGVNQRTKKLKGRMFCYSDPVSPLRDFLCFDLSDSCPQKERITSVPLNYLKQALTAVTDR